MIAPKPAGAEDELLIGGMMPVAIIIAASAAALVGVSLFTRPPAETTVNGFFMKSRPASD